MALWKELSKTKYLIQHRREAHHPEQPILRVSHLSVRYDSGVALEDVSFEVKSGERLAVVGPNGAGKSTLFKVIAGVLTPNDGQVHVYGSAPDGHICIAYVPQRSQVDWNFPVSVADVVMMGRIGRLGLFHQPRRRDWEVVRQALAVVNLEHLAERQIGQLSGGQQQRMFIARALAQEAELMLMDEPLTGLDVTAQEDIFSILEELRRRCITVLVALHDIRMAAERFERVMLLNHRLIALGKPAEVFSPESLLTAYGGHLRLVSAGEGIVALGDTCCDESVYPHA